MDKELTQWEKLKAEFPIENISWRASHMNSEGTSALALAYIDARDTMNRLDEVVGPENWKDSYHVVGVTTMCTLEIKIGEEWVSKTDGAGVSDIEAEKGAISDAFKRAGVKWGIGRYLYDIKSPWVPCESYQGKDGKNHFKKFTADPWDYVKGEVMPRKVVKPVTKAPVAPQVSQLTDNDDPLPEDPTAEWGRDVTPEVKQMADKKDYSDYVTCVKCGVGKHKPSYKACFNCNKK